MKKISTQLKAFRKQKGMSQAEFSKWIGINKHTYLRLEHDRHQPSGKVLSKILKKVKINFL
jgi:DNA-binding XRE family transcriptional regulator